MARDAVSWEAELGWEATEAAARLTEAFERRGWQVERPSAEVLETAPAGARLSVQLTPLPPRQLGATVRLPRCQLRASATGDAAQVALLREAVRMALLRGGG